MSHIHRAIVNDEKRKEPLLNLYGKIRKGIEVAADLGSPIQRRLMAVGLLEIDDDGNLHVRNRLYENPPHSPRSWIVRLASSSTVQGIGLGDP